MHGPVVQRNRPRSSWLPPVYSINHDLTKHLVNHILPAALKAVHSVPRILGFAANDHGKVSRLGIRSQLDKTDVVK